MTNEDKRTVVLRSFIYVSYTLITRLYVHRLRVWKEKMIIINMYTTVV